MPTPRERTLFLLVLLFGTFFIGGFLYAWTNPSQAPPGGNVGAPLNMGGTTQTKAGGLNIGGNLNVTGTLTTVGNVGIGGSPSVLLHPQKDDASNDSVLEMLRLTRTTAGSATSGIGSRISFEVERAGGSVSAPASLDGMWITADTGNEDGALVFNTSNNGGVPTERVRIDNIGNVSMRGGVFNSYDPNTPANYLHRFTHGGNGAGALQLYDDGVLEISLTTEGNSYFSTGGNFAIGTADPGSNRLYVTGGLTYLERNGGDVLDVDRDGSDGVLVRLERDSATVGDISASGGVVSYNAFTGSHYAWTDEDIERGMLVSLTGVNRRLNGNPGTEIIYGIRKTGKENDSAVLGAYLSLQEPTKSAGDSNPHLVAAVGNADVWVADNGENIAPGDYLVSSRIPGHAIKYDGRSPAHIIGKAAENVDWAGVSDSLNGVKRAKVSVLLGSILIR